jgi:hypothetical protein
MDKTKTFLHSLSRRAWGGAHGARQTQLPSADPRIVHGFLLTSHTEKDPGEGWALLV